MGKRKNKCICHDCETEFQISVIGAIKSEPEICPFCGSSIDVYEDHPLLKNFEEYDEFDDIKYFSDEDDDIDDE